MPINDPFWLFAGLALCVIGIWLIRWAARNNMSSEIKDAAVSATLSALAKRGRPDLPNNVKAKMSEFEAAGGVTGKAKTVARYAVRNSLSQVFGVLGFILLMAGLVTAAIGIFGT